MALILSRPYHNLFLNQNTSQLAAGMNGSQEELGFKANIHRTYIGSIERGEQNISIDNIDKLARALKMEVKDFFK